MTTKEMMDLKNHSTSAWLKWRDRFSCLLLELYPCNKVKDGEAYYTVEQLSRAVYMEQTGKEEAMFFSMSDMQGLSLKVTSPFIKAYLLWNPNHDFYRYKGPERLTFLIHSTLEWLNGEGLECPSIPLRLVSSK